jgi:RNase H-fold protein (predicted Holliday junction resolvase)
MASRQLTKVLTTPSKVASALDWKRSTKSTILSLDIQNDRIGMAVASHPSLQSSAKPLDSIRVTRRINENVKNELNRIVKKHKVCAFVVSWPVQADSGRHGAACGRVLNTLEQILLLSPTDGSQSVVQGSPVTPGRPVCLWNTQQSNSKLEQQIVEDDWGRSPVYSRPCHEKLHRASEQQYNNVLKASPASTWNNFVQANWPEIAEEQQRSTSFTSENRKRRSSSSTLTAKREQCYYVSLSSITQADDDSWMDEDSSLARKSSRLVAA